MQTSMSQEPTDSDMAANAAACHHAATAATVPATTATTRRLRRRKELSSLHRASRTNLFDDCFAHDPFDACCVAGRSPPISNTSFGAGSAVLASSSDAMTPLMENLTPETLDSTDITAIIARILQDGVRFHAQDADSVFLDLQLARVHGGGAFDDEELARTIAHSIVAAIHSEHHGGDEPREGASTSGAPAVADRFVGILRLWGPRLVEYLPTEHEMVAFLAGVAHAIEEATEAASPLTQNQSAAPHPTFDAETQPPDQDTTPQQAEADTSLGRTVPARCFCECNGPDGFPVDFMHTVLKALVEGNLVHAQCLEALDDCYYPVSETFTAAAHDVYLQQLQYQMMHFGATPTDGEGSAVDHESYVFI